MVATLAREMELFHRELTALLASSRGQFVLIGGDPPAIVGVYATDIEAIEVGYAKFGLFTTFLVKLITNPEPPKYFSRNLRPCPT